MEKFIIVLILFLASSSIGQITIHSNDFSEPILEFENMPFDSELSYGVKIPIDESFKKYDRVVAVLLVKIGDSKWSESMSGKFPKWYPKSKEFKNLYGTNSYMKLYLHEGDKNMLDLKPLCSWNVDEINAFNERKYKIQLTGAYEDGTTREWNEDFNRWEEQKLYTPSKTIVESPTFSFEYKKVLTFKDEMDIENLMNKVWRALESGDYEWAGRELSKILKINPEDPLAKPLNPLLQEFSSRYSEIIESYKGFGVNGIIGGKYKSVRVPLLKSHKLELLASVEKKLVDLKGQKLKELAISLNDESDPIKIAELIVGFQ